MTEMDDAASKVKLVRYAPEHRAALELFQLPEEKRQFTALPGDALADAAGNKHKHPVVLLAGDKPAGFFILDEGEDAARLTPEPGAVLLRAFSIDEEEQGKGYAKAGLRRLAGFVRELFPACPAVVLAVNARNAAAKSLYLKCGFEDRGGTRMGPKGLQHILIFPLAVSPLPAD